MAGYGGDPEVRTGRNLSTSTRYTHTAVEIKIPIHSLAQELKDQLPLASAYKGLPKGRNRAGGRRTFCGAHGEPPLIWVIFRRTNPKNRSRVPLEKLPEITVVARTKKKTA
jgi:hypothetical protein